MKFYKKTVQQYVSQHGYFKLSGWKILNKVFNIVLVYPTCILVNFGTFPVLAIPLTELYVLKVTIWHHEYFVLLWFPETYPKTSQARHHASLHQAICLVESYL